VRLLGHLDARLAGQLGAFEALWPEYYEITTSTRTGHTAVLSRDYGMYGLVETLGSDPEADQARLEQALEAALQEGLILDAVIAKSDSERRAIWEPREDVWQVQEQYGITFNFDVSLAIEDMAPYLDRVRRSVGEEFPKGRSFAFGHIADGNLHIIVTPGAAAAALGRDADEVRATAERIVYEPLRAIGGSISAEHGIGLERRMHLDISRTAEEIATMRALKRALDPKRILNPGKVIE
jgi:FAD/FMN-containing dehydrogenase